MDSKFKVISDGTMAGTHVFAPNGKDIADVVQRIVFTHEAGDVPKVEITIVSTDVEIETTNVRVEKALNAS